MKKSKLLIFAAVGVVLVAAVFVGTVGYFLHSQKQLNAGLWEACGRNNAAAAGYWLAKGAEVNARDYGSQGIPGRTALHMCAHFPKSETVDLLLLLGANPNATDKEGRTPLFFANDATVANQLIAHGADVTLKDDAGDTALQSREKHGWHLDDELRAALENKSAEAEMNSATDEDKQFVRNTDGVGRAYIWGIHFHVANTVTHQSKSSFQGSASGKYPFVLPSSRQEITLGEVTIVLEKSESNLTTLKVNGKAYGTVQRGDKVGIAEDRTVTVNDSLRVPAEAPTNP